MGHRLQARRQLSDSGGGEGRGGSRGGGLTPPKDCPADSEIWRKGVADGL